jgi:APA family basic amino acid/polyamine antiporter
VSWKHIFAKKKLEILLAEMEGDHRLRRVLGPVGLTSLGVGCIIGAGIFVMTGRAAADDAGPAVTISFTVAALGCVFAALCYAEFAAMAPVAGSAYTYAYATLGEIFAWIIGWDLILEYAMGCATVASAWTGYFNSFLHALGLWQVPDKLCGDPFTEIKDTGTYPWLNLPAAVIVALTTIVLVIGIRESARTNAVLVIIKLAVVLLVIAVGWQYINTANWTEIPVTDRLLPQDRELPGLVKDYLKHDQQMAGASQDELNARTVRLTKQLEATYRSEWVREETERLEREGEISPEAAAARIAVVERVADQSVQDQTAADRAAVEKLLPKVREKGEEKAAEKWGVLALIGLNQWLVPIDDAVRNPFAPYGLSGIMLGASIVFFAYIGFDSISTHAEEARRPQRDVPIGILVSLLLCTVLYIAVAAVVTGMMRYSEIDYKAPIALAFQEQADQQQSRALQGVTALISIGGLAGMTSVLLVTFLSQARIFMAMARDGLMPKVFGTVHARFRTPHLATIVTGVVICVVAALTPIKKLEEMVNVGTLLAFVMVCAAVWILRYQRPDAKRPFRCPVIGIVAPLGIVVNLILMLFLPLDTWLRLVIWLALGLLVYFLYSRRHSHLTKHLLHEIQLPLAEDGAE